MALFAGPKEIEAAAASVLNSFGAPQRADGMWHGHVFNLGHGISQYTPPESVEILVNAVHDTKPRNAQVSGHSDQLSPRIWQKPLEVLDLCTKR